MCKYNDCQDASLFKSFTIVERLKGVSQTFYAFRGQTHHFPYITGTFTLACLLQLISKHLIFFIMMITMVYPVINPDLRFLYEIHRLKPPGLEYTLINKQIYTG